MHPQKRVLVWIVLLGGTAVVASYLLGLALDPARLAGFWGGVPWSALPAYTLSMVLATAGYFAYTYFLLFRVDPAEARIARRFGYRLFHGLYLLILLPSAVWLPLTAAMLAHPSPALWAAIRLVLGLVAAGSLGILAALLALRPKQPARAYWLAVAGSVAFSFQTAVLDALVWTSLFGT